MIPFKNFNNISLLGENTIIAGSAVLDKSLSDFAMKNDLTGFEFLSCIPGTIGGGIRMNAGCFGKEFKDILLSIQAIDKSGNVAMPFNTQGMIRGSLTNKSKLNIAIY